MLAGGPGNPINTGESQGNQASPSIPTIQNGPIQWITQPRNHTRCLLSSRSALDQNSSASASRAIARACARRRSTRRAADALRPETSASPRKAPQSKPGRRREAARVPYGERPRPVGLPLCVNFPGQPCARRPTFSVSTAKLGRSADDLGHPQGWTMPRRAGIATWRCGSKCRPWPSTRRAGRAPPVGRNR